MAHDNFSPSELASQLELDITSLNNGRTISAACLTAPRRSSRLRASEAHATAKILFSSAPSPLQAIVQYEKTIVLLKNAYQAQTERLENEKRLKTWTSRIRNQGSWDPTSDPLSPEGFPALPMPVTVSSAESLEPFFQFLSSGEDVKSETYKQNWRKQKDVEYVEFDKGIFYDDGRMDLCKQVLGPNHIGSLLQALENNLHIQHFLLGNNIIGPHGARVIAQFTLRHPERIQTWYLAGCCIDSQSFEIFANALMDSPVCRYIWLKRNPLQHTSASIISQMLMHMPNLVTLDLDMTNLGDLGVQILFDSLNASNCALRTIYLNGVGIGRHGCAALARFISQSNCSLENLYMATNPIGDGILALCRGLMENVSLLRLSLPSVGLTSAGAAVLFASLQSHPRLMVLDVSHSYTTEDLGQRYNYIDDTALSSLTQMINNLKTLRSLRLGITAFRPHAFLSLQAPLCDSALLHFVGSTFYTEAGTPHKFERQVQRSILSNVRKHYGEETTLLAFKTQHLRFLHNPQDVVFTDSLYRTRDVYAALKGIRPLVKWWDEDSTTLEQVAQWNQIDTQ